MPYDSAATPAARPAPGRDELVAHLNAARITGRVATPRENNRDHYRALAAGERHYWLGLEFGDRWRDEEAVLALMAERCDVVADPGHRQGQDSISADLCVDALERMADVLRKAAESRSAVLVATGHPGGLLPVHRAVAAALRASGCPVLTAPEDLATAEGHDIRVLDSVAVLHRGGNLLHTHSAEPMRLVLDRLQSAGAPLPDLVVADHGWAGHAAWRGITTVGFADCNDPALFVGEAEGTVRVTVPLDDNVPPHRYAPMTAYLLAAAGLADAA